MVNIIDKRSADTDETYAIGDWIWYKQGTLQCLCVLAQTLGGQVQIICIENKDANRCTDPFVINEAGGTHSKLSKVTIDKLTDYGKATIEKVNVSIEITNHNS